MWSPFGSGRARPSLPARTPDEGRPSLPSRRVGRRPRRGAKRPGGAGPPVPRLRAYRCPSFPWARPLPGSRRKREWGRASAPVTRPPHPAPEASGGPRVRGPRPSQAREGAGPTAGYPFVRGDLGRAQRGSSTLWLPPSRPPASAAVPAALTPSLPPVPAPPPSFLRPMTPRGSPKARVADAPAGRVLP